MADKNYRLTFELSDGSEKSVQFAVPQGEKGEKGDKGENGAHGSAGRNGVSATHSWNGTVLTVSSASGTSSADLKGETGSRGESGVYILASGQTIADAPMDAKVVIDPFGGGTQSFMLAPQIAEVGQALVVKEVDGEGKPTKWGATDLNVDAISSLEDLLPIVELLPESTIPYSESNGAFYIESAPALIIGNKYTVRYNGTDYVCIAQNASMVVPGAVGVGNLAAFGGYGNREPFAVGFVGGVGLVYALDGADTVTVSILETGKIPMEYLGNSFVVNLTRDDSGVWTADKSFEAIAAKVKAGYHPVAVVENFGYQNQTIHVPFTALSENGDYIVFNVMVTTHPFKDKETWGNYLLSFAMMPGSNYVEALAARFTENTEPI